MALERGWRRAGRMRFDPQGKPALPTLNGTCTVGRGVLGLVGAIAELEL